MTALHNVTECQRRLIILGYLASGEDDGKFGTKSLDAFNHYRAAQGIGPVVQTSLTELNEVLFPEDQPPQRKTVMGNLLGSVFSGLLGNFLKWDMVQGYLRHALTAAGGAIGLDGLVGADGSKAIIGALMVVASVVFSAIANNTKKKAMDVVKAVDAAPNVTLVPASETSTGKPRVVATP